MAWSTPVYDRTKADVEYIKSIITRIRDLGYSNLTLQERNDWESATLKGAWNLADIVRIEDNISYLATTLTSYGYPISITAYGGTWSRYSVIYLDDLDRIKNNIQAIIDGFYGNPNSPTLVLGSRDMSYTIANDIEKVIADLKELLDGMVYSFKICGTFNCGATIFL